MENNHCLFSIFISSVQNLIPELELPIKKIFVCSLFLNYGQAASAIYIQLAPSLVHSYLRIGVELES